jgi:hypothetical protein
MWSAWRATRIARVRVLNLAWIKLMRFALLTLLVIVVGSAAMAEPLPVPPAEAQKEAADALREVFGREWEQAVTPNQKSAFGKKLLSTAGNPEEDASGCFVMLRTARDVGAQAGDVALVKDACAKLETNFALTDSRTDALQALAKNCKGMPAFTALTEFALNSALMHASAERFEAANACMAVAENAATRAGAAALIKEVAAEKKRLRAATDIFEQVPAAEAVLEKSPTDPAANDTLGRYYCLHRHDWEKGLSYLALSKDAKFSALAADDLRVPKSATDRVALADSWWDEAEAATDGDALRSRAAHWYRLALPEVTGLSKARIEKRVAQVTAASKYLRTQVGDVWRGIGASLEGHAKGKSYNTSTLTISAVNDDKFSGKYVWKNYFPDKVAQGEGTTEGLFDGAHFRLGPASGTVVNGVAVIDWRANDQAGDACYVPDRYFDRNTMAGRWQISQGKVRGEFKLDNDGSATQTIQPELKGVWIGTKDLAIVAWINGWRSTINKDGTIASYADDSPMTKPPTSIGKAKQLP